MAAASCLSGPRLENLGDRPSARRMRCLCCMWQVCARLSKVAFVTSRCSCHPEDHMPSSGCLFLMRFVTAGCRCRLQMHAACMLMIACLLCPSITSASRTVSPCRTSIEWPLTKPNDDRIPRANALMLQGLLEGLGGMVDASWSNGSSPTACEPPHCRIPPPKAVISRAVHPSMPSIPRQPPQKYKRTKRSPCPPHRLFHPLPSRQPLNLSNSTQAHLIWWWCTTARLPIKYLPLADYGR